MVEFFVRAEGRRHPHLNLARCRGVARPVQVDQGPDDLALADAAGEGYTFGVAVDDFAASSARIAARVNSAW